MSLLFGDDTSPEMEAFLIEGYRRMSPSEKLKRVVEMNRTVQLLAVARIREQYPRATEHEVKMRLGALWLGAETMREVLGWDPDREGY